MASTANSLPDAQPESRVPQFTLRLRRFTVAEFQRIVESGALGRTRVELLEGWIVNKMTVNPPHAAGITIGAQVLGTLLPPDWVLRIRSPIVTSDSVPEPDFAVVRGPARRYNDHHPKSNEIGLLIEVSDATLEDDRGQMARIYARANISHYWIINLRDGIVEVYTQPKGGKRPAFTHRQVFQKADKIPPVLDGVVIAEISVADLLP